MDTTAVLEPNSGHDIDVIDEMRLRTWARRHYLPADNREEDDLHPVVLDEMARMDHEGN